jgi:hypothetical protein
MNYIDDATNRRFARFYAYEGVIPAMDSMKRYIKKYGMPESIYLDRHSTYKSQAKQTIEDELNNKHSLSQFERAAEELGIKIIHANSPQAKGRVERDFRTHQDRLVKEMRLEGISDIKAANNFLPRYLKKHNERFGVEPAGTTDMHRPIPEGKDLNTILCIKVERHLRNDFTVLYNKKLYQILDKVAVKRVKLEEGVDGRICIKINNKKLSYKEIKERPKKEAKPIVRMPKNIYRPSMTHPFKHKMFQAMLAQKVGKKPENEVLNKKSELALINV